MLAYIYIISYHTGCLSILQDDLAMLFSVRSYSLERCFSSTHLETIYQIKMSSCSKVLYLMHNIFIWRVQKINCTVSVLVPCKYALCIRDKS